MSVEIRHVAPARPCNRRCAVQLRAARERPERDLRAPRTTTAAGTLREHVDCIMTARDVWDLRLARRDQSVPTDDGTEELGVERGAVQGCIAANGDPIAGFGRRRASAPNTT